MTDKSIKLTQIKSSNGRLIKHKQCLMGLGIRRINKSVVVIDTPENRGLINKISYMLRVEEQ